jgi:hypothetical protein
MFARREPMDMDQVNPEEEILITNPYRPLKIATPYRQQQLGRRPTFADWLD